MKLNVVVAGAAGRTGRLVFEKLQSDPENFSTTGIVRDMDKAVSMFGSSCDLVLGDVTDASSLEEAFKAKDALVVLTGALPRRDPPRPDAPKGGPPSFSYPADGTPEMVDWEGSKNMIDMAKRLSFQQIVFVGSMGSTDDNHHLNRIANGNILRYKRKAEVYLTESGVPYTIINPAGLTNEEENERELVVGRNDELFTIFDDKSCIIPRGDVARTVVAALKLEGAKNKAMDIVGRPKGEGVITNDFVALFDQVGPTI